jgi:hypothetical protein
MNVADEGLKGVSEKELNHLGSPKISSRCIPVFTETEKGETGESHFIGTDWSLPSNAESADLLDFEAVAVCFQQVQVVPHVKLQFPLSVLSNENLHYFALER